MVPDIIPQAVISQEEVSNMVTYALIGSLSGVVLFALAIWKVIRQRAIDMKAIDDSYTLKVDNAKLDVLKEVAKLETKLSSMSKSLKDLDNTLTNRQYKSSEDTRKELEGKINELGKAFRHERLDCMKDVEKDIDSLSVRYSKNFTEIFNDLDNVVQSIRESQREQKNDTIATRDKINELWKHLADKGSR